MRRVRIELKHALGKLSLGRFRIQVTSVDDPLGLNNKQSIPDKVLQIVNISPGDRTPAQRKTIGDYYRSIDSVVAPIRKELAEHKKTAPKLATTTAHVMIRRGSPRETHIHKRGNFLDRGARVNVHTPAFLHELKPRGDSPDRLDLARWITRFGSSSSDVVWSPRPRTLGRRGLHPAIQNCSTGLRRNFVPWDGAARDSSNGS